MAGPFLSGTWPGRPNYILVQEPDFEAAAGVLTQAGQVVASS